MSVVNGHGRMYTPAKTARYEERIALAAADAMQGQPPTEEAVGMIIRVGVPVPGSASRKQKEQMLSGHIVPSKKPDLDNYIKSVQDGINQIAYKDDKQVLALYASKTYSDKPGVDVTVFSLGDNPELMKQRFTEEMQEREN